MRLGLEMRLAYSQEPKLEQLQIKKCPHCGAHLKPIHLMGLKEGKLPVICPVCHKEIKLD